MRLCERATVVIGVGPPEGPSTKKIARISEPNYTPVAMDDKSERPDGNRALLHPDPCPGGGAGEHAGAPELVRRDQRRFVKRA